MQHNHTCNKGLLALLGIRLVILTLSCNKNKAADKADTAATDSLSFLVIGDWGKDG
ncbi:MAG: hypothetical protein M3Y85_10290 [Bacteroidota bacterium]|nr:hypothetical protein [Bacteroidota bacterium]